MKKRIEWVDVFKGIAILLVVIGHSNSPINGYIYSFHMAAFLFISGFLCSYKNKDILEYSLKKIYTLIIPFILSNVGFIILVEIIIKLQKKKYFYVPDNVGFLKKLYLFFTQNIGVDLAGATWFLLVLFQITILFFFFKKYLIKRNIYYFLFSLLLFIYGYYLAIVLKKRFQGLLDLVFIGQFYYTIGYIFKEYRVLDKIDKKKYIKNSLLLFSLVLFYVFNNVFPSYVDFPSRGFRNPFFEVIASISGVYILFYISKLIENSKIKFMKQEFIKYGKNSLSILIFHFLAFRIIFFVGYKLKFFSKEQLSNLVPISKNNYWLVLSILSIYISILCMKPFSSLSKKLRKIIKNSNYYIKIKKYINKDVELFKKKNFIEYIKKRIFRLSKFIGNKSIYICLIFLVVVLYPIYKTGISINDELQARFYGKLGIKSFFSIYFQMLKTEGRIFSIPVIINIYLNFFSRNHFIYKMIEILIIISNMFFFGYFIMKVTQNKKLGQLCMLVFISFLPMNWELMPPNAFNGLLGISITLLFISLISYCKYLDGEGKKYLITSIVLFVYCLFTYEIFILYFILYIAITWKKTKNLKKLYYKMKYNIFSLMFYLFLYFLGRILIKSSYTGNQIKITSLKEIISKLFFMIQTTFPGYYILNKKYQYLVKMNTIKYIGLKNNLVNNFLDIRIIIFIIIAVYLFKKIINKNCKKIKYKNIYIIFISIILIICPLMLRLITKFIEDIGPEKMIGLPNTYFSYFSTIFLISFIVYKIKNKILIQFVLIIFLLFSTSVQIMNEVISKRQQRDYNRMIEIERIFDTEEIKKWDNKNIYSQDLYETKNSLGIHEGYWTDFASSKNLNIKIEKNLKNNNGIIVNLNDKFNDFFIISKIEKIQNNEVVSKSFSLLSPIELIDKKLYFKLSGGKYQMIKISNGIQDKNFYKYNLDLDKEIVIQSIDITD